MLRLLADEHIDKDVVRGTKRREPLLDFVRVQDVGLLGAHDDVILEWAATEQRIVVSKDHKTLIGLAYQRVAGQQSMPGVLMRKERISIGQAIDANLLAALATTAAEWKDSVQYLP